MTCATFGAVTFACSPTPAAQPRISVDDAKAHALKLCLDGNYERSGGYVAREVRDESYLTLRYQLSDRRQNAGKRLAAFVESSTSNYYRAQLPMKDEEGRGPFNRIFEQCMGFYRSRALADFIKREL
ncbi:hypothetical protein DX912_06995 [Lysobacter soli]|uniref:Uncharacterized protein n=1 Tax=Lysobacter soli TaxID=453783 RepID=A0A3D8VG97_9GAMM|nr:hypothetical protein DX912_06995 [Lysobacter soli]